MKRLAILLFCGAVQAADESAIRSFKAECDEKGCKLTAEQTEAVIRFQQGALATIRDLNEENKRLREKCYVVRDS